MSEVRPLYFDRGTNQITESQPGDTLALPVTSTVIEYVTLFQDTEVNTCCALIDYTAIPVVSTEPPILTYRKEPFVDCIILEAGLTGQRVQAAITHGKNYITPVAIVPITDDILYLGQDGKLTVVQPSLVNGDRYSVVIGRLVNFNEFIFDPATPVDFTGGGGSGGNLPPIAGSPDTWLYNDGANVLWKKLSVSDLAPAFAINSFSCSTGNLELGQSISSPHFSASYNLTLSSARLRDSVLNTWQALTTPYLSFNSPGTFINSVVTSVTFTLEAHASDGTIKTANSSIAWLARKFWGTGVIGTAIGSLQSSALSSSRSQSFTVTANANEYIYLAIPSSFGTPIFYVGGFEGGFQLSQSAISITNPYNVTLSYNLWRSDNHSLGTTIVGVS